MNLNRTESIASPNFNNFPKFSPKLSLCVLASGNGSNFEAIAKSILASELNAKLNCLIVNNPNCLAIQKAKEYSIPCIVINHRNFNTRADYDMEIVKELNKYRPEIVVMAGWMRIATKTIIEKYKNRLINIHPSLLPSFKGYNAIHQALESKVKITGCTVHIVEENVDSGEIIIQSAVAISEQDNEQSLLKKIQIEEHQILVKGIAILGERIRLQ